MKNETIKEEIKRIDNIIAILTFSCIAIVLTEIVILIILIQNYLDYGTF